MFVLFPTLDAWSRPQDGVAPVALGQRYAGQSGTHLPFVRGVDVAQVVHQVVHYDVLTVRYLFLGIYPLIVVAVGISQVVVINAPLLCFACTLMMLFFYIRSMNNLISLDPLTQLNNRGQLQRYINEEENMQREGLTTFVIMIDVNDFKNINDTYGHAEGDRALILISDALREAVGEAHMPAFLGRYGGDEFILIVYARDEGDVIRCVDIIRRDAENACRQQKTPYLIGLGIGWEEMQEGEDFQNCMERADRKLYIDKRQWKQQKDQQAR